MEKSLTRTEFRNGCLKRDNYKCIWCGEKAIFDDENEVNNLFVHHIYERRLWKDGSEGYYFSNGVSVCDPCHIKCVRSL